MQKNFEAKKKFDAKIIKKDLIREIIIIKRKIFNGKKFLMLKTFDAKNFSIKKN